MPPSYSSHPQKRRKTEHIRIKDEGIITESAHAFRSTAIAEAACITPGPDEIKNGESINSLREMILGELDARYTHHQRQPGKYLALDCEMVGVGIEGKESSLARVSLVNYYGVVQLDEFVRQRERVVDYRTQWSGVRRTDMANAKPFGEIQQQVADLLKGRILVGHAVFNDLKALLLSHPGPSTRDTQQYAYKHKIANGRHPALRTLVQHEFGIAIQGGEHSSVTDARATMAVYRLYRRQWEKGEQMPLLTADRPNPLSSGKRKRQQTDKGGNDEISGGGRKGISSGLSTVVKRPGGTNTTKGERTKVSAKPKTKWWTSLENGRPAKEPIRPKLG